MSKPDIKKTPARKAQVLSGLGAATILAAGADQAKAQAPLEVVEAIQLPDGTFEIRCRMAR